MSYDVSASGLEFAFEHLPLNADQPIEVHAFRFEPSLESFASAGVEFDKHLPFDHVDEDAFGVSASSGLHAPRESFGALAREASKRVLGKVAWHRHS
jgi:hypothetical protein